MSESHITVEHSEGKKAPREFRVIDTDVLVIGAGQAGVESAITAAICGADVIIADKKGFGRCGDSGEHSAGRMTSSELGLEGDNPEVQLEDAVQAGEWVVDQKLGLEVMKAYAEDKILLKSENYGNIHWRDIKTGEPKISYSKNKPRLWEGYKLNNHSYEALKLGCKVSDYCTITKLLTDDKGAVVGATAIDFRTGEFYVFRAKSTVLATGGECQIFGAGTIVALHGGGVYGLTGDGHAMAASLGAELRDLEFRSLELAGVIYPTAISSFLAFATWAPAEFTDKDGVKFLAGIPSNELTLRRVHYEVERVLSEGRGGPHGGFFGPVDYLYGTDGTGSGLKQWGFFADDWDALKRIWEKNGLDLGRVEQFFSHTYDHGGIVTDGRAETGIAGLYAAGECAMHCGAGYMVFRMFSSGLVTGKWAGKNAAARSKTIVTSSINLSQIADEYDRVFGTLYAEPDSPRRVHKIRRSVQDAAWKGSGSWRSEKKCHEALAELDRIRKDELPKMYVADKCKVCNLEWMEALETINMITMAQMDTLAALTRTESRGTHLRNEYPDMDNDNWLKNVYIKMVDGKLNAYTKPAVITKFVPPSGKFPCGGGTIAEP
jgi:succinate dehydrogenase/fumarate reductase flavoprotein subunit